MREQEAADQIEGTETRKIKSRRQRKKNFNEYKQLLDEGHAESRIEVKVEHWEDSLYSETEEGSSM